jgi:hypothetical protein
MLAALGTLHLSKVNAADFVRCNWGTALRANSFERRLNSFEIDFLLPGHTRDCLTRQAQGMRTREDTNEGTECGT